MRARVNEIDLLRFIAACSVVLFHYTFRGFTADGRSLLSYPWLAPAAKYGYLGVELFFMISGFVILMTAASGSLREFVASRVGRLFPAFWICCTLTFAVTLAFGAPRYSATAGQYLVNLTMLADFFGVASMDGAYWSLYVELVFYALIGMVLATRTMPQVQRLLVVWLVIGAVLGVKPLPVLRTVFVVDYAPYFVAGAACYLVWSDGLTRERIAILAGCFALSVFQSVRGLGEFRGHFNTDISAPVVAGIVATFYVAMLAIALRRTGAIGRRHWGFVGALTYPLYLLHQNIGFIVFNRLHDVVNPHALLWGTVALMLAAAYGVHVLVERPFGPALRRALLVAMGRAKPSRMEGTAA